MAAPYTAKWGIMATGGIAEKFVGDLLLDPAGRDVNDVRHDVVAVASSTSADRASAFIKKLGCKADTKAYGSYEELVKDANVDIIYVASPHSEHYANTLLALEHGKAVCCEKPFTINAAQTKHLAKVAREKNVFLMEAVWIRFFPLVISLKKLLHQDRILGKIHRVHADFAMHFDEDPKHRLFNPDLGGGALLDLGIYPLTWIMILLFEDPDNQGTGEKDPLDTDKEGDLAPGQLQERVIAWSHGPIPKNGEGALCDDVAFNARPADEEKDACKNGSRHCAQNDEERPRHRAQREQADNEVSGPILDDPRDDDGVRLASVLASALALLGSQKPTDERRDTEEKKVPVKASRPRQGKLPRLGHDGADVVVKVEEDHDEKAERGAHESPLDLDVPEINKPRSIHRGEERLCDGQPFNRHLAQAVFGKMTEAGPKDATSSKGKRRNEVADTKRQRQRLKFENEELDALLDVDDTDIEAKCLAGHVGDEACEVAYIEDGDDKVECGGPDERPGLDAKVVDLAQAIVADDDVVLGIVDQINETRDADESEWLDGKDGKDDGDQCRSQDNFVEAVCAVRAVVHVDDV
ncbi:hypothetical protein L7F22_068376 [Adiantum nelumboides]|nr:hypothetical protein [Adiantum nelumboides]